MPFVNCCQFIYLVIFPFGFEGGIWDLIVSVPDHCLSFYIESMWSAISLSVFQIALHIEVRMFIMACPPAWTNSAGMLSTPADFHISIALNAASASPGICGPSSTVGFPSVS